VTTDTLTALLLIGGTVLLFVLWVVMRRRIAHLRRELNLPIEEYPPPASLAEWRRRAQESQHRSSLRRTNRKDA
jgi:hypothetical protein